MSSDQRTHTWTAWTGKVRVARVTTQEHTDNCTAQEPKPVDSTPQQCLAWPKLVQIEDRQRDRGIHWMPTNSTSNTLKYCIHLYPVTSCIFVVFAMQRALQRCCWWSVPPSADGVQISIDFHLGKKNKLLWADPTSSTLLNLKRKTCQQNPPRPVLVAFFRVFSSL